MRDARYENWFKANGVMWDYLPAIPLGKFDVQASLDNQARSKSLDHVRVSEYAALMREGVEFPAVVGWTRLDDKIVLITGNHRLSAAFQAGEDSIDAYLVRGADNYTRRVLTETANNVEGETLGYADRLDKAVSVCREFNKPAAEVAKRYGIHATTLTEHLRLLDVDERLGRLGVQPRAVATSRATMAKIQSDQVLERVHDVAAAARYDEHETHKLVQRVVGERSEAAQLRVVERVAADPLTRRRVELAAGGRTAIHRVQYNELARYLHGADKLLERFTEPAQLQLVNRAEAEELHQAAARVHMRLTRLLKVIE